MQKPLQQSTVERPRNVYYKPELDVLRFFAFLLVFAHHLPRPAHTSSLWNAQAAAGTGVCIFFLLSAYLITELLMREREKTGTIHVPSFFVRRMLRIWPLYFFAIALALVLGAAVPAWRTPWQALPWLVLLAGNFWVAKAGWALGLIGPLWSLSVEEQFYLAIPTVMKLGDRRALRVVSWVTIAVAYAAVVWLARRHGVPHTGIWVNSLVQFQFFAAGTLLAIGLHGRRWRLWLPARGGLLLVCLLGLVMAQKRFGVMSMRPEPAGHLVAAYLLTLACCIGIFLAFLNAPLRFPKPLTYLGRISYGLYVYHAFVLGMVMGPNEQPSWLFALAHPYLTDAGCLLATIGLAAASFHLFERRVLRLKEKFAFIQSGAEGAALRGAPQG